MSERYAAQAISTQLECFFIVNKISKGWSVHKWVHLYLIRSVSAGSGQVKFFLLFRS